MQSISLQNIYKSFGTSNALDDVNLQIGAGQRVVLIGGNGAGKTTLLRVLAGVETPDQGCVVIGNTDVTRTAAHRRGVAFLSQDYAIYPHLDVIKNLHAALAPLKLTKAEAVGRVEQALAWFTLDTLADRRPSQLSGGQLQRVALAKAVVRRPDILLLDEPFSQLDPQLREEGRQLILQMVKQFVMTLVMVTHDALDALRLADLLVVMEAGKVVQVDSPKNVYQHPHTRSVAELLGPFGINELVLDNSSASTGIGEKAGQPIFFRPEAAKLCLQSDTPMQNVKTHGARHEDVIFFQGEVQQVQMLGFGSLIRVCVHGPQVGGVSQFAQILLPFGIEAPETTACFRLDVCDLLSLPTASELRG
jgi:ABC-type sugar transport system ATPase subunit